jgi:hypothetical protein
MMRNKIKICIMIIVIGIFNFNVNAEIYKWTDKKGVVHFSDKNPQGTPTIIHQNDDQSPDNEISNLSLKMRTYSDEEKFQHDVLILKALKQSLNNPDSFQLVTAIRLANGTLCLNIRGTNAFNALILAQEAIDWDGKFLEYSDVCSGRTGKDITYIKQAVQ